MKKLIAVALILFSTLAAAESWETRNEAGGRIVITDRPCRDYKQLKEAYAISSTGETLEACWAWIDGFVHVAYRHGEKRIYDPAIFTKVQMY